MSTISGQPQVRPGVVDAIIRRLAGFDLHETVILPENGEKLIDFAAHPSGLAVAMRYLVPAAEYDEAGAVTDPESGLTFNVALADGIKRIVKP